MSFTQSTFSPVGANSTNSPAIYSYLTLDSVMDVTTADYFSEKRFQLEEGDIILTVASDAFAILSVLSDTSSADAPYISGGGNDAKYLGVFADLTALQTAHPTAVTGSSATVTSPDGNLFWYDGAAWQDTGTGFLGDMLKAVYDPNNQNTDAFSMGNMAETASSKVLTNLERDAIAQNTTDIGQNTTDIAQNTTDIAENTPVGIGMEWYTNTAPTGWVLQDGAEYDSTDFAYAPLFAVIGTTFNTGGEGPNGFRVPRRTERMPIGRNVARTEIDTVGKTGGSFDHDHTVPAQNGLTTADNTGNGQLSNGLFSLTDSPDSDHSHEFDVPEQDTQAANPPFITINWIIKL